MKRPEPCERHPHEVKPCVPCMVELDLEKAVELLKTILLCVKIKSINMEWTEREIEQFLSKIES
jgi:hypothetical protein